MRRQRLTNGLALLALSAVVVALPSRLGAQGLEQPGVRAGGMAGAFVAVADDATAGWWNPAGLATIRLFDASIDVGAEDLHSGHDRPIDREGAARWRQGGFFLGIPVLGVSLNRLTTTRLAGAPAALDGTGRQADLATGDVAGGRQDEGSVISASVLRTTHVGVTLVQSVSDAVVVGGTVRLVRGRAGALTIPAGLDVETAFELAEEAGGRSGTRVDADLGVMVALGRVRIGAAARNIAAASFETPEGERLRLERQVRVGVAVGGEPAYRQRAWQLAADADLLAVDGLDGERRTIAVGGERWWANRRLALRGGAHVHTVGAARVAASLGGSVAIWSGLLVEARVTDGGDGVARGWGVAARVAF